MDPELGGPYVLSKHFKQCTLLRATHFPVSRISSKLLIHLFDNKKNIFLVVEDAPAADY